MDAKGRFTGDEMKHKDKRTEAEWWVIRPHLRLILCDADLWCERRGVLFILTGLIRSGYEQWAMWKKGISNYEHSVHEYGRGGDASQLLQSELNPQLLDYINSKYIYDPKRPNLKTAIWHGGTAMHLHFQTLE